jgi:predicted TIM-barrel fold metal-dependent hydrolase
VTVAGEPYDDVLIEPLRRASAALPEGTRWTDAHTHTGQDDPDGVTATVDELLGALDRAGHERAVVFTTAEPGGYPPANDRVLAEAEGSGGRLVAFCRVDPNTDDPAAEAVRCLDRGAAGIKLHPRSDAFVLSHRGVEALAALADERAVPILIHAGRGIPALGTDALNLARRFGRANLILAHAGISDIGVIAPALGDVPNMFFDSAWWQVSDLLTLYALVAPSQILYASDIPYGSGRFAAFAFLRCAREVGLGPEALAAIAGGNVERILAGEDPADLGPAPGMEALSSRWLAGERVIAYTSTAVMAAFRGAVAMEPLALARLATQAPLEGTTGADEAAVLAVLDELLAHAQAMGEANPDRPRALVFAALAAQIVAGTPRCGV